jgi:hypothetical protein
MQTLQPPVVSIQAGFTSTASGWPPFDHSLSQASLRLARSFVFLFSLLLGPEECGTSVRGFERLDRVDGDGSHRPFVPVLI